MKLMHRLNYHQKLVLGTILLVIVLGVGSYGAYHYIQRSQSIVRIDDRYIHTTDYQPIVQRNRTFLESQGQAVDEEIVARDAMNQLIDEYFIAEFAEKNNLTVSDEEVDARYAQMLQSMSEAELSERLNELYGYDLEAYRDVLRSDIKRERVQAELDIPIRDWLAQRRAESHIQLLSD